MITMKKKVLAAIIAVTLVLGVAIGRLSSQPQGGNGDLAFMLRMFSVVLKLIETNYVEPKDPAKLVETATSRMVSSLDPFSELFTPEQAENFQVHTQGKFGGVGMEVGLRNGWLTVIAPIEGTPAEKAGLKAGDRIIKIDGQSTWGMTLNEAVEKIRGKPGTKVVLTIARPGMDEPFDVELTRAIIVIHPVRYYKLVDGNIGYVRFVSFSSNSTYELKAVLDTLKMQGAKKYILDLRSNPGGHLREAIGVANLFLQKGDLIVFTKGRNLQDNQRYYAQNPPEVDPSAPLIVLVDGGSASASEIVSGAVQDWDRGLVVGDTTVGKGSVQRLYRLDRGYTLKLTIARYYTPSGRCIDRVTWGRQTVQPVIGGDSLETGDTTRSDTMIYYTKRLKRPVRGGGGIIPDIVIEGERAYPIVAKLIARGMFFQYAIEYVKKHPNAPKKYDNLKLTSSDIKRFKKFLKKKGFEFRESDFREAEDQIKYRLTLEIAEKYWGMKSRYYFALKRDRVFKKAVKLLEKAKTKDDLFREMTEVR